MVRHKTVLRRNCLKLVKHLSISPEGFNHVLDRPHGLGVLSTDSYTTFLHQFGDSSTSVKQKVRNFLIYLDMKLTEEILRIFINALREEELTEVAQLIEQNPAQSEVCRVKNLRL